jgi:hypothetical protein
MYLLFIKSTAATTAIPKILCASSKQRASMDILRAMLTNRLKYRSKVFHERRIVQHRNWKRNKVGGGQKQRQPGWQTSADTWHKRKGVYISARTKLNSCRLPCVTRSILSTLSKQWIIANIVVFVWAHYVRPFHSNIYCSFFILYI